MLAVGVRSCGLDFVRCALNRVSWASAAESWEVRTVGRAPTFSFGSDARVPPKFVQHICIFGGERAVSTANSRGRAFLLAVSGRWLLCH